jgi:hypothetical protein
VEIETQFRLHGQMTRSSSYLLQFLAALRRYRDRPNKDTIDRFINDDSLRFIQSSINALEKKPVPYNVSIVYKKIMSEENSIPPDAMKEGLTKLESLVHEIREGERVRKDDVETSLKFLTSVIHLMDSEAEDLGKRLYGSSANSREIV